VVADTALSAGWDDVAFFDERYPAMSLTGMWPVVGSVADLLQRVDEFAGVVVGIGNGCDRLRWQEKLAAAGAVFATVVHERAWVSPRASLGEGSVVVAGAVINIGAAIGAASIINTGATVDHDCILGRAVHVAPGAHLSGDVQVGDLSWIGVGAAVRQGIVIGAGVIVGAGAVVVTNLPDGVTAVGCPAKPRT